MTDDFSSLTTGAQCYVLNNATTIYSYKNNLRETFVQVGGKWKKTAQSTYNTIPSGTYCISYNEITSLNSNAAFEPIYAVIAFGLAVFVWACVWSLWRKVLRLHI